MLTSPQFLIVVGFAFGVFCGALAAIIALAPTDKDAI
jgi:hypothetical protein